MESTLFTRLTATEEANLSGGTKIYVEKHYVEKHKKTPKPPKEDKYDKYKYPVVKYAPITIDVKNFTNVIAGNDNDGNVQINQG